MKIFAVRHGQSEWNAKRILCGTTDIPLTGEGRRQAEELAMKLKADEDKNQIKSILVSPLLRARETAEPIEKALGIKAIAVPELHERSFGIFEGKSICDPELLRIWNEPFYRLPGGESPADVASRIYPVLDRIRHDYNGNVLLVCHGALIRVIDTYFNARTMEEYKAFSPKNCTLVEYETERSVIEYEHLV